MKLKQFFVFILFFPSLCFAQTETWTLAATAFQLNTDANIIASHNKKLSQDLQSLLPKLLLESFEGKYTRLVSVDEQMAKEKYTLEMKKKEAYKSYETSIQKRDAIILEGKSKYVTQQTIKAEEKKIRDQEANIQKIQKEIDTIENEKNGFSPKKKQIVSYQSGKELFVLAQKTEGKVQNTEIPKENVIKEKKERELDVLSKNIDALISADMEVNGDFLQISLYVEYFPQSLDSVTFSIISPISDVSYIVSQMHRKILESLINDSLVHIAVSMEPAEVKNSLVLHIDDEVYKTKFDNIMLPKGKYTLFAEVEGYAPLSFVHNFDKDGDYNITLRFKKIVSQEISVFAKDNDTSFSLNAQGFGTLPAVISLEKGAYLGEIETGDWSNYFFIKEKDFTQKEKQLSYLNYSIEDKILKSRNRLYFSYGAVLFALPLYLFTFSHYNTLLNAELYDMGTSNVLDAWRLISTLSFVGVSALGLNMGVQLVIYLNDANKVIPK